MAMQKQKTLSNGVTGDYWIVSNLRINNIKKKVMGLDLLLFVNETMREASKEAIYNEKINIEVDFTGKTFDEVLTEVYTKIKESNMILDPENSENLIESNWFVDAIDC